MSAWQRQASIILIGGTAHFLACSSTRLDPTSGAITVYAPMRAAPVPAAAANSAGTANHSSAAEASRSNLGGSAPEASGAGGSAAGTDIPAKRIVCSSLPDPAPSRTDRWVELTLRLEKGTLSLSRFRTVQLRKAAVTKRVMGRFAAEIWIGCELIDRVRFDFPLVDDEPTKAPRGNPSFAAASSYDVTVSVPESDRATRLELVDRATNGRQIFDWPLQQPQRP